VLSLGSKPAHDVPMAHSIVPDQTEALATGWEPDLPPSDTLVRRAVLVHASWALAVAESLGKPARRTDRWSGGLVGRRGELTNPVVVTQPMDAAGFAEVLPEVAAVLPADVPFFLLSPFPTPDLRGHGLVRIGHPPLMVRFPGGENPRRRAGIQLREVSDADDLAIAERVLVDGYPMPDLQPLTPGDILAPPILDGPTRIWMASLDGEPAAVAAAHVAADAILVEYVAALPAARGRGAAAAATWAATLCEPALPAVLIASDDGRPLYERMGYVAIERWTAWIRPRSR
jgi:hypothetical protein